MEHTQITKILIRCWHFLRVSYFMCVCVYFADVEHGLNRTAATLKLKNTHTASKYIFFFILLMMDFNVLQYTQQNNKFRNEKKK